MRNFTLIKRKAPRILAKVQSFLDVRQHPLWQTLTFGLVFAGIGGYLIYHSFALTTCACGGAATPPTSPTSLAANPVSASEIDLRWGVSTSSVGVAGYNIYEVGGPGDPADGDSSPTTDELVGQTSGPSSTTFKLIGLESYTTYGFYVRARDTQGGLSAPSNQAIDTTFDDSSDAGMFAAQNRISTNTTTWPYKSPFGDSSCIKNAGDTTPTPGCICQKSSTVTCNGTCVVISDNTSGSNTGTCRPANTYKDVCYDKDNNPFYCEKSAVMSSVQDEGGDYYAGNSVGTPIYAMGNGKILDVRTGLAPAVLGNGSFGPTWITYKLKYNGSNGTADGLNVYIAEYCNLAADAVKNVLTGKTIGRKWQAGDYVNSNSILCTMKPKSIETGWAMENSPSSGVLAKAYICYGKSKTSSQGGPHVPTQYGFSFSQFIYKSGGPKALHQGYKNGHYYNYIYTTTSGAKLHFFPCSDMTSDYKGNWY